MKTLDETMRSICVAKGGSTEYGIVIASGAEAVVVRAAYELRGFIGKMTGAELPILTDSDATTEKELLLGDSARMRAAFPDADARAQGDEGYRLLTRGGKLAVIGAGRGVLYGVYGLLEDWCGCRFFAEDCIKVPARSELWLPEIDDSQAPVLEYREPYFANYNSGDLYSRWKSNGNSGKLGETYGGGMRYVRFVHSMQELVPPEKYFDSHPEYFALIDGERRNGYRQPCLTNPDVLKIATEKVKEWLRADPTGKIVSISQNDNFDYCRCEACAAVDAEEESHAGTLLRFVNAIAEAIEPEFPDVIIDTLAYQYTRKPPKYVKPRRNVIIRLCSIECCFSHPIETCDMAMANGQSFRDDLIGWGKICDRIYVWDYVVNFHHTLAPFPDFPVLKANIKFFIEHGVRGVFEEGNNSARESGEFCALRQYILAKLLWNPDFDVDAGVNEFLAGYYGMAAPEIRRYFDLIHAAVTPETHAHFNDSVYAGYLRPEDQRIAAEIFDRAERLADDDMILRRVQKLRLSPRFVELYDASLDEPGRAEAVEEFLRDAASLGITELSESRPFENGAERMRRRDENL